MRLCLVTPFSWSQPHDVNEHVAGIAKGLRDASALTVATFLSAERLSYPPGRAQRDRLLARLDALVATSEETAEAAAARFTGHYEVISEGVDPELFRPGRKRKLMVIEWRPNERPLLRGVLRELAALPDWELLLLRTKPLTGRPTIPRLLRNRVHVRTARDGATRAPLLAEASVFVPALAGLGRVRLEAAASGCAIAAPPGVREQPELAGAEAARLAENTEYRERKQGRARAEAESQTSAAVARRLDELYRSLSKRRHASGADDDPLRDRPWILADLRMHTSWSHDCAVDPADLIMYTETTGPGAIAVTDHNILGGAQETAELARDHDLIVIPGEEVKTDDQGEVIGLFLREEIPRGLSFADTVAA